MHVIDVAHGVMGTSAVVASTISHAVGYAYAMKLRGGSNIVVSFFGDGAAEEGAFYESLNLAQLKRLPILFVCENNGYAVHTHISARQSLDNIWERARVYGIPSRRLEWDDVLEIHEAAHQYIAALRDPRDGPRFLECRTYRWREHVGPNEDWDLGYRSRDEALPWMERDQVPRIAKMLPARTRQALEREVEEELTAAFAFAEASPFPDDAELYTDVVKDA